MVKFYKSSDGRICEIDEPETGCWINIISPDDDETEEIMKLTGIEADFLKAALDDEESSRIEIEDNGHILFIIDIPIAEKDGDSIIYTTLPLAFIITESYIVTVCLKENTIIKEFASGMVKNVNIKMRTRFILQVFYKVATRYLQYLKQIDKISSEIETRLHKSMKNQELIQLLDLEKSLVYFTTSLRANELVMRKVARGRIITLYEDDEDLLDDVIVEIQQAIEMANIYSNILSGTMDAFASIISNNLNIVMKFLASITIVMTIPTIVASIYGMNVPGLPFAQFWWFPVALSAVVSVITAIILNRKNMF